MTISQVGLTHKGGHRQNIIDQNDKKYDIVKYGCKNIGARPALRLTQ